nr:WGR domain-containing protein [Thioalkalivibrio sp. ALE28]
MTEIRLLKVAPDRNQFRFYRMFIQRGLFGEYAVCREWGRIGHPGTTCEDWCSTADQAEAILGQRAAAKVRHGYTGLMGNAAAAKGKAREGNGMKNGKGLTRKGLSASQAKQRHTHSVRTNLLSGRASKLLFWLPNVEAQPRGFAASAGAPCSAGDQATCCTTCRRLPFRVPRRRRLAPFLTWNAS